VVKNVTNADGSIVIAVDADDQDAQKKLNSITKKIERIEETIYKKQQERIPLAKQADDLTVQLDAASKKLYEMQNTAGIPTSKIATQEETVKGLQAEWSRVQRKLESIDSSIARSNVDLDLEKEKAGEVQRQLAATSESASRMPEALDMANQSMEKFANRVAGLARRVFVFSLITSALRAMRTWMSKVVKTNSEATAAMAQLKGALLTLAQPLVNVIIPAFTALVQVLTKIVTAIANVTAKLFGTTIQQSAAAAESLNAEVDALDDVGSSAKKASKSMASFDEINQLSSDDSTSGGGSSTSTAADFSSAYASDLDEITAIASSALLAIGVILALSGINVPLGIALIALGAVGLVSVISSNPGAILEILQGTIGEIVALVSVAFLAIGAILVMVGGPNFLPLGIGLLAMGAVGLAATVAANWDWLSEQLQGALGVVTGIVGGFALVIGIILCLTGTQLPLGVALIAAGAAALVSTIAANWDWLSDALQGPLGIATGIVGGFTLVIGIILCLTGVQIPLGVALIAAGAIALITTVAANWDWLKDHLDHVLAVVEMVVGMAMLVIGIILCLTGVNLPYGIALIASGAITLVSRVADNWEWLSGKLQGVLGVVTAIVGVFVLAIGIILCLTGTNLPLGIALIAAGAIVLVTTVAANWSWLAEKLQGEMGIVTAAVSVFLLAIGLILCMTGVNLPLGIALVAAGAVGLVTVTALNWDAILQKLKGVWEKIKAWWDSSVKKYLTIDYWKNVGKDIIDGFLKGLKNAWTTVTSWVSDAVSGIKEAFSSASSSASAITTSTNSASSKVRVAAPALATGAVIPPNREFMAVLGDQKSGTNIETPLATMVQAFRQALAEANYNGSSDAVLMLDKTELGRIVYKLNKAEGNRVGVSLTGG
jgi:hypothetical protein